jgi:hypothetical protein
MFQVVPEPEFSGWFESLPEPLAEEVATAIDLAASASAGLAPERLSRLLLWFDGTGDGHAAEPGARGLASLVLGSARELPLSELQSYLTWHEEVLLCLSSAPFRSRLERLEPVRAQQALAQVEQLKRRLHAARISSSHASWSQSRPTRDPLGLRASFEQLLALVGLETALVLGSGSGLRELCIDNVRPKLRVLFGLDFPARRLIAILGETLDRAYYGDSVKRAEQRWKQYVEHAAVRAGREAP